VSSSSPLLEVDRLSAAWDRTAVLRSVSFKVEPGEFLVILGPNGSGKTTLLRCIAGLESPTAGSVRLGGTDVTATPPHRRGIGLMFQDPALFPRRSVYENIAYAPLIQRRPRAEVEREVEDLLGLLRLRGFEDRRPNQLSGGERQRVALARTLAARPRVVLLDEPFASIDVELKGELHAVFREALRSRDTAAVHVTHDRAEGLFLADRVGLLFDGVLDTLGTPAEVYAHPRTVRSARFLGYNILGSGTDLQAVHVDDLTLVREGSAGIAATIRAAGSVGREGLLIVETPDGHRLELRTSGANPELRIGAAVRLRWNRSIPLAADPPSDR
jgi:ABC-type Fe3+/spermidine/putrescine transport system ATPase subunit